MTYTRRQFGRLAMASLPVAAMSSSSRFLLATAKPNSIFNGVLVGVITPYSYHFMPNDAESLLKFMVQDGISGTEIQCPPVEEFASAPKQPAFGGGPRPAGPVTGQQVGTTRPKPTLSRSPLKKHRTQPEHRDARFLLRQKAAISLKTKPGKRAALRRKRTTQ
jgi:hypothetical protein